MCEGVVWRMGSAVLVRVVGDGRIVGVGAGVRE